MRLASLYYVYLTVIGWARLQHRHTDTRSSSRPTCQRQLGAASGDSPHHITSDSMLKHDRPDFFF